MANITYTKKIFLLLFISCSYLLQAQIKNIDSLEVIKFKSNYMLAPTKKPNWLPQKAEGRVLIKKDSVYFWDVKSNLNKTIALADIENIKKEKLTPSMSTVHLLLLMTGEFFIADMGAAAILGSFVLDPTFILVATGIFLPIAACAIWIDIQINRILTITTKDETFYLYSGTKSRKIFKLLNKTLSDYKSLSLE